MAALLEHLVPLESQFMSDRSKDKKYNESIPHEAQEFLLTLCEFYMQDQNQARSFYYQQKLNWETQNLGDL